MDTDKNGTIDIDEFIAFMQVADRVRTKNLQARVVVFNIRKSTPETKLARSAGHVHAHAAVFLAFVQHAGNRTA